MRAVYEAGPTGFGLARAARAAGIEMMVCSPGAIPRQPGDRVKTDKRDALKLARLHAAGQLRAVFVPDLPLEALRDLVRAREDLRGDLMAVPAPDQQAVVASRPGLGGPGRDLDVSATCVAEPRRGSTSRSSSWSSPSTWPTTRCCSRAATGSSGLIAEQAEAGPGSGWSARLRCLRGIDTLTAVGLVAEIGDIQRLRLTRAAWPATSAWSRQSSSTGDPAPAGRDHQGRIGARPPAADRSGLALPATAARLA